jgi:GNAT superfamily N-acetyltransferase
MGISIVKVESPTDLAEIKALFREYFDWIARELKVDMSFQSVDEELAGLPGAYAAPDGRLLLGRVDGRPAGCVALRPHEPPICEMKRMYVRPAYRGRGLGQALCAAIIAEAREHRYRKMRLDTEVSLKSAQRIYTGAGFKLAPPYYEVPEELKGRILFMVMGLE